MIYYHGTDRYFRDLKFPETNSYKDFGIGVYLAEQKDHAIKVAYWKRGNSAYLYTYSVDINSLKTKFNIRIFRGVSIEWIKYIIQNRVSIPGYDYDAVIGPTADAKAQSIIQNFVKEHNNPSIKDYKQLQKDLKTDVYGNQICIKSQELLDIFNKSKIKELKLK